MRNLTLGRTSTPGTEAGQRAHYLLREESPSPSVGVEMFRPDAWRMGALATAQWFAIGGIVLGGLGLLMNHVRQT